MGTESQLYLGFDLSTQSLKCVILDRELSIVHEDSVVYSRDLPSYQTTDGFHKSGNVVTSPTPMWIEALDLLLSRLSKSVALSSVIGIGGCAQQHGTVYTSPSFLSTLSALDPAQTLLSQLGSLFAVPNSPIWMDGSTEELCKEMERDVGGAEKLAALTGSKAHCRFSAHQIHKIIKSGIWGRVERVMLDSNFLCSLFTGSYSLPELSDSSGMNILNIKTREWDENLCTMDRVDIREKLGAPSPAIPEEPILVSNYMVERYSFPPSCRVSRFVGDNPATLIGLNLGESDIALSLGTSDVVVICGDDLTPSPDTHTFCHPLHPTTSYMQILCYKNASLTREELKTKYCKTETWKEFERIIRDTKTPLVSAYFPQPEILPFGVTGSFTSGEQDLWNYSPSEVLTSIIEGQFLSKSLHSSPSSSSRLVVVGGASTNTALLELISNAFSCPVYRDVTCNVAALGAAYLGVLAAGHQLPTGRSWDLVANPDTSRKEEWDRKREEYRALETKFGKN